MNLNPNIVAISNLYIWINLFHKYQIKISEIVPLYSGGFIFYCDQEFLWTAKGIYISNDNTVTLCLSYKENRKSTILLENENDLINILNEFSIYQTKLSF